MTKIGSKHCNTTASRIEAMRRLTELLAIREMSKHEISDQMGISYSGCRNYIAALLGGGIIEISRREETKFGPFGQPVYRLIASQDQIEQFLKDDVRPVGERPPRKLNSPGRSFHILADDSHFVVKVLHKLPVHEELHAAFWAGRVV